MAPHTRTLFSFSRPRRNKQFLRFERRFYDTIKVRYIRDADSITIAKLLDRLVAADEGQVVFALKLFKNWRNFPLVSVYNAALGPCFELLEGGEPNAGRCFAANY